MTSWKFADLASVTVSSGGTTAPGSGSSESWTVAAVTGTMPTLTAGQVFDLVDPALPTELMTVTATASGTSWTVTRGAYSTTPVTHTAGFTARLILTAGGLASLQTPTVSADVIWDTKGDLAVATGADTAAKLPVGGALSDRLIADSAASTGLKWTPHVIARTSDSSNINSGNTGATLTNDSVLLLPLAASEVWFFQAWILFFTANTTMDAKFGWSVPASATMSWGFGGAAGASVVGYGAWAAASSATGTMLAAAGSQAVGGGNGITQGTMFAGIVTNSTTPGNLNLQVAQNTSDAGNLIVKAGSLLLAWRIV